MNRTTFLIIFVVLVVVIFAAMWWGWRARAKRDADVVGAVQAPTGSLIAHFPLVFYISTTAASDPISRVAAPALRYRGYGEVSVLTDGVTLQVRGEAPVHFAADQLRGGGYASRRPGKAVERDGLALMKWVSGTRDLESSFRFQDAAEQRRFVDALDQLSGKQASSQEFDVDQEGTS